MSLGPIFDVAIGLILVYLLLGLMATAIQEMIASFWKSRGKMLRNAIQELLSDGACGTSLFEKVFGHPMISGTAADDYPSYVPSRNFALAVIDTLSAGSKAPIFTQVEQEIGKIQDGMVKKALLALLRQAGGDLDGLKTGLATWYDDAMDRLSGVYKRQSQARAIMCGVFFAVALNVDSIQIAETLWTQDGLRAQVVASAQSFSQKYAGHPNADAQAQFDSSMRTLSDLNLPIGWIPKPLPASTAKAPTCTPAQPSTAKGPAAKCLPVTPPPTPKATDKKPSNVFAGIRQTVVSAWLTVGEHFWELGVGGTLLAMLGWIMTALAVSLGAPFWFDILQQVLNLRGTGPKPATAADAASGK